MAKTELLMVMVGIPTKRSIRDNFQIGHAMTLELTIRWLHFFYKVVQKKTSKVHFAMLCLRQEHCYRNDESKVMELVWWQMTTKYWKDEVGHRIMVFSTVATQNRGRTGKIELDHKLFPSGIPLIYFMSSNDRGLLPKSCGT